MSENEGFPDNIRLIRFLDLFMIKKGGIEGINQKLVLKDLQQKERHLTIMVLDNSIIEIHETTEGHEKQYNTLARIDLSELDGIESPSISRDEVIAKSGVETIDLAALEYQNLTAFAPDEGFGNVLVKRREALITKDSILPICKLSQIAEYGFRFVVVREGNHFRFVVMKMGGKYYKVTLETMCKMLFLAVPEIMKIVLAQLGLTESEFQEALKNQSDEE